MRIGLVTGEYPPMQGGVGAHCRELARELTAQGHTVFVYSDARAGENSPEIALTRNSGGWGIGALRAINRWARDNRLDLVNLHFQTAAYQMSPFIHWLPDAVSVPVVTTFHDLRFPYLFPKAGRLRGWIVMRLARASDGVISTNHEDFARIEYLPHAALIPIGSSVHAELPADFDRSAWRAKMGASGTDFVVAHFGFINHTKGVDTLLNAAARLIKESVPVKIWLMGGRIGASDPTNAANAAEIDALIDGLGLAGKVHWTGFLSDLDVAASFAACDVTALLFTDGASYRRSSLMAAVGHGCAILTTTPAVPVPSFRDGENMRLVPPGNIHATADALTALWNDVECRQHLRTGARLLAHEFDWDVIARANADFFARVIAGART